MSFQIDQTAQAVWDSLDLHLVLVKLSLPLTLKCPGLDEKKKLYGHPRYKGNENKCGVTKKKKRHLCFKRIVSRFR